jgi:hypothetical protein
MDKEKKDNNLPNLEELLGSTLSKQDLFIPKTAATPLSLSGSFMSNLTDESSIQSLTSFSGLNTRIDEICGRDYLHDYKLFASPLEGNIWTSEDKLKELTAPSMWAIDSVSSVSPVASAFTKDLFSPKISALASLEEQSCLIARDVGIPKITSVASQISTITGLLSPETDSIRELIAPTSMLTDLQSLATLTHRSIVDSGIVSEWQLGVVNSASYLVDRQIDWTSQLCSSIYGDRPFTNIEDLCILPPKVNAITYLPIDLEIEKSKKKDITPEEAFQKSNVLNLTEKGKRLINKIVDINRMCERKGRDILFKYTGGTTIAAATMGGTVCSSKGDFGEIVDGLYMLFYENLERIKKVVSDDVVRNDKIFQCVFRVKDMRTDYRHDYEHGSESDIKKKIRNIGESYSYYAGTPVLASSDEFLLTQKGLYDDFDVLADYLLNLVKSIKS